MTQHDDQQAIAETVTRFFRAVEAGEWTAAQVLLTDMVDTAHGQEPRTLSSDELVSGWRKVHAQREATRYRLGPLSVELPSADHATARCNSHVRLVAADHVDAATLVLDGRYTIELERGNGAWRIRSIRHDEI